MGNADWVIVLAGSSETLCLPHGERLHFGILSVCASKRFLCLYAVGVGLIALRVVVGRFCSFLTVFCFACLLEMLIAGLGALQGRYSCVSYTC